ncbi:hypothetical protein EHS13_13695 [Paenibacillus psychroresistens]|uniref:Uncharacterized protein n=1 Tax=Paenibacillus psychroresistens TaxID=1778678 RepID=A0A6B8RJE7_9BACL|nr:hypothetical protein [Paenibacillus psychroresistens]QGQ95854.1 hypothetical protein EHS13_13695 [Paenibacillus psychroresistens]
MKHGLKFVDEFPVFGDVLEKLYLKRELDNWYSSICQQEVVIPLEINAIPNVLDIDIRERYSPSTEVFINSKKVLGEGSFMFEQEVQIRISKIIPVYSMEFCYGIRHNTIISQINTWGPPQTEFLINAQEIITKLFASNGYILLGEQYDLYDTVFDWKKLKSIDPVNRRLTLGDAVFVDILDLCL